MQKRMMMPTLVAASILLAGCTATSPDPAESAPASSAPSSDSAPSSAPSMTPTTTPAEEEPTTSPVLTLTNEGITLTNENGEFPTPFTNGAGVLAAINELTGIPPTTEVFAGPDGNEAGITLFDWGDVKLSVSTQNQVVNFIVSAPSVGDVSITTASGITVGSTRAEVIAAGGFDVWDEDGDGVADYLGLDATEVEGTLSLINPGTVGRMYVEVTIKDDVVIEIHAPANDFSDV